MVHEDLKPSDILTRDAFLNAIVANSALGGSTNAVIHLQAMAAHAGVELSLDDWQEFGHDVPLMVNLQPAGEYLSEDFHQAGGVPAVVSELIAQGLIREDAMTVNGRTIGENCKTRPIENEDVIRPFAKPLLAEAGFSVLRSNFFDSAIMKTSVISPEFRERYLSNPEDPNAFEGVVAVYDGPEDYHARIDDPSFELSETSVLVMRGAGPIGYPGAAEVVNMRPPSYLIKKGITALPCIGDGRQSGTSGSPSILHVSPEAAVGGLLAVVRDGDRIRIDLNACRVDLLVEEAELAVRHDELTAKGGFPSPASQTPWQEIQRGCVAQLQDGMVLKGAPDYQRVTETFGLPRDNH